ncbi:MAG TPA: HAMP domain-containing methyl-accepting chemotaxis protein [Patescibacteria group bacterium]|nr:HAMP domain-containing methyl-accepting chemotaxis protein [Patescibacteria group bacterium]
MTSSIRKKLILGFVVILVIMTLSTIYNLNTFNNSKHFIGHIKDQALTELKLATDMKNEIIQTRLYLTDASMSNSMSAAEKAKQHAAQFKNIASEIVNFNSDYTEIINELNLSFDKFNDYGSSMIGTFMENSHDISNKKMEEFDKLANDAFNKIVEIQNNTQNDLDNDLLEMQANMDTSFNSGIVVAIGIIILSFIIAIIISKGISRPINSLLLIFNELEKGGGDLTKRINIKSKDEMGEMAKAFNKFMDSLEQMVYKIKQNAEIVSYSSNYLSEGSKKTSEQITMLNNHMDHVKSDSANIKYSINQITESILEIAASSQTSAVDAQSISSAAGDINALSQASSKNALEVRNKMHLIQEGSNKTVSITQNLGKEADKIGKIIDTIKAITDQTNLLALNASIEAARAGEAGKGFAVVANEIRNLAENNNESAKTIEGLIFNIQSMIQQTISATADVGSSIIEGTQMVDTVVNKLESVSQGINEINNKIQSIAVLTEEQGASTEELSAVMESINTSNNEISSAILDIATNIDVQTDTIKTLSTTASELNESAAELKGLVYNFKVKRE